MTITATQSSPPRCTDCEWMTRDCKTDKPLCKRPGLGEYNVVTGGMLYPSCEDEREYKDWLDKLLSIKTCGVNAKYFQPNDALIAKFDSIEKLK